MCVNELRTADTEWITGLKHNTVPVTHDGLCLEGSSVREFFISFPNINSPHICVPYHFRIMMLFLEIHAGIKNRYLIPKHRAWLYKSENCLLILLFTRTKFPRWEECNNWEISCFSLLSSGSSNYNWCPENLIALIKHKHLREKSSSIIVTLSKFLSLKERNFSLWKSVSPLRTLVGLSLP